MANDALVTVGVRRSAVSAEPPPERPCESVGERPLRRTTVTLVWSTTTAAVCTLAYHLGCERPLWRKSNAECRPASVARGSVHGKKQERSLTQTVGRNVYVCLPDLGLN